MEKERLFLFLEAAGTVSWVLMARFWLFENQTLAMAFAIPAVFFNFATLFFVERSFLSFLTVVGFNSWVLMDVLWMIGDFTGLAIFNLGSEIVSWLLIIFVFWVFIESRNNREVLFNALKSLRKFRIR